MSKKTGAVAIGKVVVALLIGAFLTPLAFAAGAQDAEAVGEEGILNETGYPIVNEPLTLKGISYMRPFHGDWDEMLVWELYEEKTGVHIDWDLVPWPERTTKTTIILASGDLPDFFMSIRVGLAEVLKYAKQGMFIRLNELIDEYGSNIKKMYDQYPEVRKGTTTPEGDIFYTTNVQGLYRLIPLYANKVWMENLGLELNASKTRIVNARQDDFSFLGYTFGLEHNWRRRCSYFAARPSQKAVQRLKANVRGILRPYNVGAWPEVVARVNRSLRGWKQYFSHGTVYPAYRAIDNYVVHCVQDFLRRRHKVKGRRRRVTRRWPDKVIFGELGVIHLLQRNLTAPSCA